MMIEVNETASTEDVQELAAAVPDNWALCQLFEGRRRACEAEYMVAETIHASRINAEAHGRPFSFKGDGVHSVSGAGLADNGTAYAWLVDDGYFVEDEHEGRPIICMTSKLVAHGRHQLSKDGAA